VTAISIVDRAAMVMSAEIERQCGQLLSPKERGYGILSLESPNRGFDQISRLCPPFCASTMSPG